MSNIHFLSNQDASHFDRPGFSGDVYIGEDKDLGVTALQVNVYGSHPLKRMTGDTVRMYYVVRGQGEFVLNGIAQKVTESDCVVIEPGGEYSYTGEMTLFEVNSSKSHTYTDEKL